MVRAPCCEKMGLKKGPWTREEDQILINYVTLYGHGNWRALPKQAGLLRCGKSCRLRWTNYLRPDIKRGNFTREEEDTIISLHGLLGNRWSAIAARLPGRTDNEIKNVWHTHLKKRLKNLNLDDHHTPKSRKNTSKSPKSEMVIRVQEEDDNNNDNDTENEKESKENYNPDMNSPQRSSATDQSSSVATTSDSANTCMEGGDNILDNFPDLDEDFWSEVFSANSSGVETSNLEAEDGNTLTQCQNNIPIDSGYGCNISNVHDGMDFFWYDIFNRAGELPKLPELL